MVTSLYGARHAEYIKHRNKSPEHTHSPAGSLHPSLANGLQTKQYNFLWGARFFCHSMWLHFRLYPGMHSTERSVWMSPQATLESILPQSAACTCGNSKAAIQRAESSLHPVIWKLLDGQQRMMLPWTLAPPSRGHILCDHSTMRRVPGLWLQWAYSHLTPST